MFSHTLQNQLNANFEFSSVNSLIAMCYYLKLNDITNLEIEKR